MNVKPSTDPSENPLDQKLYRRTSIRKIILYALLLVLFLFATNPTLIPFLSASARESVGNVWKNLFGDVDSIAGSLKLSWTMLFKLTAIVLLLFFLTSVIRFVLEHVRPKTGKGRSMLTMAQSALNYCSVLVGIFWGMSILGVGVSTIFASVGVVALVISFGAESLIEDVITGFFLVLENQFNVGDIIEINGFRGTVERIGIRTTYIRDAGNNVKVINNSDLRNVLNRYAATSYAVCDIPISYSANIEEAERVLKVLLPAIRLKYPDVFLVDPAYLGVQELSTSSVKLRVAAEIGEENIYMAPRLLNRELKIGFDNAGIEIPFQQVVVHHAN